MDFYENVWYFVDQKMLTKKRNKTVVAKKKDTHFSIFDNYHSISNDNKMEIDKREKDINYDNKQFKKSTQRNGISEQQKKTKHVKLILSFFCSLLSVDSSFALPSSFSSFNRNTFRSVNWSGNRFGYRFHMLYSLGYWASEQTWPCIYAKNWFKRFETPVCFLCFTHFSTVVHSNAQLPYTYTAHFILGYLWMFTKINGNGEKIIHTKNTI